MPSLWQPGSLHTVTLRVRDDGAWGSAYGGQPNLTDETTITLAVGSGLECADAAPSRSSLWTTNYKMAEVNILGVLDAQGNPALITITGITQDEPANDAGDGDFLPDGADVGTSTVQVRPERSGTGKGRVYNVRFTVRDQAGANCSGAANVYVPHDKKHTPVDDGQIHDSTVAQKLDCPAGGGRTCPGAGLPDAFGRQPGSNYPHAALHAPSGMRHLSPATEGRT